MHSLSQTAYSVADPPFPAGGHRKGPPKERQSLGNRGWGLQDLSQGCRELGLAPGWDSRRVAAVLEWWQSQKRGPVRFPLGLVKLLLVSVLEERAQSLAVSFVTAEAEQGPLLRAKDAHEKHDNPCPGEICYSNIFCLCSRTVIFLLLSY